MRIIGLVSLTLVGCANSRDSFFPADSEAPFVYDIGELPVLSGDLFVEGFDYATEPGIHWGQLGVGEDLGTFGGATFQFRGTGGAVCIVADPESIFWNMEISELPTGSPRYQFEDVYTDDGDIDLEVGLSSYYTGSPGVEIGDFAATYADASGQLHTIEFNECVQSGYFGDPAHAGRASVESCAVDTSLHPGTLYTGLLKTFSLPIDDSVLNFGVAVYDGPCQGVPYLNEDGNFTAGVNECTLPNEVQYAEPDQVLPEEKAWFPTLESAYCEGTGKVNSWCKDNADAGACQDAD